MAKFQTSLKFSAVAIIDSVPAHETQTGPWLRDVILQPLVDANSMRLLHYRVENRAELLAALASVNNAVYAAGMAPIVHFETHGSQEGIATADGKLVPWADVTPWLTSINRGCRMNLLAVMSMCHGWHFVSQLQPVEQAPAWALIGPIHEVLPARLQEAFQSFYPELLNTLNGRAALEAMNAGRAETKHELKFETAELWFCKIWRGYEREMCSPDAMQETEDRVVERLMRQSNYDLRLAMNARLFVREFLEGKEGIFAQYHRSFLMLDLFPENAERFRMTYQQCIEAGPAQTP